MRGRPVAVSARPPSSPLEEFEQVYLRNVDALMGFRGSSRQRPGVLYTGAGVSNLPGPPVKVLVGTDGTGVIDSGNTGAGTWHLAACHLTGDTGSGNTGNTGAG